MRTQRVSTTAAAFLLAFLAPSMVASSYASEGSAFGQKKSTAAEMQYRAYSEPGKSYGEEYRVMPDSYFAKHKHGEPMYTAPRGGREY